MVYTIYYRDVPTSIIIVKHEYDVIHRCRMHILLLLLLLFQTMT